MSPLLQVSGLRKRFPARGGLVVHAAEDVGFSIARGSVVGLVGESGSGKTTVGRCLLRLVEPDAGRALFDGVDLFSLPAREMRAYRRKMQIVFQDPYSSLNPRMRVSAILGEALDAHGLAKGRKRGARIAELLERVGLPVDVAKRFPHEFSGGQRQRIGIARALAVEPAFIVADEPVSALDVSVQAQILNLIQDLKRDLQLTMLFVAHDLSVVEYLCDEVIVMYLGHVVERGPSRALYRRPAHPYTQALIASAPVPDPAALRPRAPLRGDIPTPLNPPSGCVFRTRCSFAEARCGVQPMAERQIAPSHFTACLRHAELVAAGDL